MESCQHSSRRCRRRPASTLSVAFVCLRYAHYLPHLLKTCYNFYFISYLTTTTSLTYLSSLIVTNIVPGHLPAETNEVRIFHTVTPFSFGIGTIFHSSTVKLQNNGIAPSASKMPVYWSLPLFLDHFYTYNKKRSAAKMPVYWSFGRR